MQKKPWLFVFFKYMFILIGCLVCIISLTFNTFFVMNGLETPIITNISSYHIILFLFMFLIVIYLQSFLDKIPSKYVLLLCITIFFCCGMYLVVHTDTYLRPADPHINVQAALNMNNGNFKDISYKKYLGWYPFQLYWVTYLRFVFIFTKSISFLFFLNLIYLSLSIILFYLISMEIKKSNAIQNNVILLATFFLPNLFNIVFVYGNVLGFMLYLSSILFLLKFLKENSKSFMIVSIIFLVFASLIKSNYSIGIIANLLIILLSNVQVKNKLIYIISVIILIFSCNFIIGKIYSSNSSQNISLNNSGIPKNAWIAMGMQRKNGKYGWYNDYTAKTYIKSGYSTRDTKKIANRYILYRLNQFSKHPKMMFSFYKNKLISTWADPLFQSLWNAPLPGWGGRLRTHIMQQIYALSGESKMYKVIREICRNDIWFIYVGSICQIIKFFDLKKIYTSEFYFTLIAILFFMGGFSFHFIWETKSQYVWQYTEILIPLAGTAFFNIHESLKKWGINND